MAKLLLTLIVVGGVMFAAFTAMSHQSKSDGSGGSPVAPVVVTAKMPNPLGQ